MTYRRLRDYSRSSGYVQGAPKLDNSDLLSILYFGKSSTETPTENTVLSLTPVEDVVISQTFNFPDANNEYLYFAIPKYIQSNTLITIENFTVNFVKFDVMVTVENIPTLYEVNRSEYKQNGEDIVGAIVVQ